MEKRIGKIQSISFGLGGYQDAQIGISVTLGSDKEGWGVYDFKGYWATVPSASCKWTGVDRELALGGTCMWLAGLLKSANKVKLEELKGVPVEVTFDGNTLKEWRILTEVI